VSDEAEIGLRRARPEDVEFLVELVNRDDVKPFLAARRASDADSVRAEVERSLREPEAFGLFVIELDGEPAGSMEFERVNERSRIARLGGLAVHPAYRGGRLGDEAARRFQRHLFDDLGFHRLELEIYGFNERAIRHAERVGFVREGVRRKAYWRRGGWVDGIEFGLVQEDVRGPGAAGA
jgi:RimJ/RimL family protein N-acetyltransferase